MIKILDGREVVGYIKERHYSEARGLRPRPQLAVVRCDADAASDRYVAAKRNYGADIGVPVDVYDEAPETVVERVRALGADPAVTGIIVQLPLGGARGDGAPLDEAALAALTDEALAAIPRDKDVDGLRADSPFETATPKAIMWLLAAYAIDLEGRTIAVVGQGRIVGRPLADRLEAAGHRVLRLDETTPLDELEARLRESDIIVSATGTPGLIASAMVKPGAVVVDAGAPRAELAAEVAARPDVKYTPVPGGVGPMTVAALFDNLLIAAKRRSAAQVDSRAYQ